MSGDPFDEFEFKPITEGLGFHKKPATQNTQSKNTVTENTRKPKIEFAFNTMTPEILPESKPSTNTSQNINPETPSTTVDEILKTLGERKKYDFTEDLKNTNLKKEALLKTSSFEIAAAMLDGMLIVASFLSALIILLVVTKVDLFGNLMTPDDDGMVYYSLAALFASICWIYLVVNRMFLGFTPGEWVFDQRVGNPEQLGSADYSIRIAARATITVVTGLVLMPLISMFTNKDHIGKLLNVQLMKKA